MGGLVDRGGGGGNTPLMKRLEILIRRSEFPIRVVGEGRETILTGFLKSSKIALSILFRASLSSPGKKMKNIFKL